jgi:DNA-binding NtrC family response regulator
MSEGRSIAEVGNLTRVVLPGNPEFTINVQLGDSLSAVEERLIMHTLRHCRTQDEAARILGVSTKTLYNKLRRYKSQPRSPPNVGPGSLEATDSRIG